MSEIRKLFNKIVTKTLKDRQTRVTVGHPDGSLHPLDNDGNPDTNYIWVQMDSPTDGLTTRIVRCRKAQPVMETTIVIEPSLIDGELEVVGEVPLQAMAAMGEGSVDVVKHAAMHTFFGLDPVYIEAFQFMPLLAHPSSPNDLFVYVEPYSYTFDGTNKWWAGGFIDLTSLVPTNVAEQIAVVISLDPTTNALVATSAAAVIESAVTDFRNMPYTGSDLTAIDTDDDIRICGVRLYNGQSAITIFDFIEDLRPFAGPSGSGSSLTPSDTVEDETPYGLTPDAGISTEYSRGDHTHGSVSHDDHANLTNVTANQHHNQSHDHSASGDGTTLSPATLNIPTATSPAQTADGQAVWDSDDNQLTVGDGSARKIMANNDLANLGTTAANADVNPSADNVRKLGTSALKWLEHWTYLLGMKLRSAPSAPSSGDLHIYVDSDGNVTKFDSNGQISNLVHGKVFPSFSLTVSTTPATMLSDTVEENALGNNGFVEYYVDFDSFNNSGANRNQTITYNFGSLAVTLTYSSVANATQRHALYAYFKTWNRGATNSQHTLIQIGTRTPSVDNAVASGGVVLNMGWASSTEDTTSPVAVSVTVVSASSAANQSADGIAKRIGPTKS